MKSILPGCFEVEASKGLRVPLEAFTLEADFMNAKSFLSLQGIGIMMFERAESIELPLMSS